MVKVDQGVNIVSLNNFRIYIPTKGRPTLQKTYTNLTNDLKEITYLVIDKEDFNPYVEAGIPEGNLLVVPKKIKGIASTRQEIIKNAYKLDIDNICMLDDDITFQRRVKGKIVNSTNSQVNSAFKQIVSWLDSGYVHCGIAIRSMDYDNPSNSKVVSRMMHVLGYSPSFIIENGCSFLKGVTKDFSMDDFHMTLQLLRKGEKNIVSLINRISPSASNSKGGASLWRTLESHNKSAMQLKKNHPEFVTVKEKHGWQGMEGKRLDVIIQWKKAYESYKEN